MAKCLKCNAVFSIDDPVAKTKAAARPAVAMPKGITVEDAGGEMILRRRWFSPAFIFLVFFCAIWDGFLVVWYMMAFREGAPLIMKLFPLLHLAAGVFLTYFTVAGFLNTTIIRASLNELSVNHQPLPWFGNRSIPAEQVEQLYCTQHINHSRNGGTTISYRLNASLVDGTKVKLLSNLSDAEQALFIEQQVEAQLAIEDRPVPGEVAR
jgi:hypothetical protein